jgi:hypothetical protein
MCIGNNMKAMGLAGPEDMEAMLVSLSGYIWAGRNMHHREASKSTCLAGSKGVNRKDIAHNRVRLIEEMRSELTILGFSTLAEAGNDVHHGAAVQSINAGALSQDARVAHWLFAPTVAKELGASALNLSFDIGGYAAYCRNCLWTVRVVEEMERKVDA